jgi:methanethiol oxidase
MATWTPDPTFYPSPRLAAQAPPEKLAYVASLDPTRKHPDVMAVVDLDSESVAYGRVIGQTDLAIGDELHHFGWMPVVRACAPTRRTQATWRRIPHGP